MSNTNSQILPNPKISKEIRVRFAPSPTGYLHVGGARTVLFNWLFAKNMAKKMGAKFILRIEDTDQVRSTREHEKMQIEDIKWLGFDYQEGPDVGGPHAPYRQSERLDIYAKYAKELLDSDRAYHCFCTEELLTQKREAAMKMGIVPQYDGLCAKLPKADVQKRLASGETATVRFRAPVKDYTLQDIVRGQVVFQANMVGDFVVLRNNGMPVYNFCCVVDDHLMNITHVIRAEEHLSNTVRQMMLYESFGWAMPEMAHCSLILGSDRQKLSKRHGATSVHQYAEEGFLQETLINFLVLLGWSPSSADGTAKEIMTIDEMIDLFSLERMGKAPSVFDPVKLRWMNGQYIKAYPIEKITKLALPFMKNGGIPVEKLDPKWLELAFDTIRGHLETLADAPKFMNLYFDDKLELEEQAKPVQAEPIYKTVVGALKEEFSAHIATHGDAITGDEFLKIQDQVKAKTGAKGKHLFMSTRVALTGQVHGPELKLVVPLLGPKKAMGRIERFGA